MKNLVQISLLIALLIAVPSFGQLNKLKEKAASAGIPTGGFSKDEAAKALKEALSKGAEKGTSRATVVTNLDGDRVSTRLQPSLAVNTRRYSV